MRFAKCFIVFGLWLLMGSCLVDENAGRIINNGYEKQLEAWNRQNIVDYQFSLKYEKVTTVVIVKNGIPVSSDPPEWLASGEKSTIPEFYAFIKKEEERLRNFGYRDVEPKRFSVIYENKYHYPAIINWMDNGNGYLWEITLMSYISYEIGDYEEQLAAWNSKNMLDYQIRVHYWDFSYEQQYYKDLANLYKVYKDFAFINVKNGIPVSSGSPEWLTSGKKSTVPEFYALIKDEEKRIREEFNGSSSCSLIVHYGPEHYPRYIYSDTHVNKESWEIILAVDEER